MLELTEEQQKALETQKGPLHLVNPRTQEVFVLIRQDVYNLTRSIVGGGRGQQIRLIGREGQHVQHVLMDDKYSA